MKGPHSRRAYIETTGIQSRDRSVRRRLMSPVPRAGEAAQTPATVDAVSRSAAETAGAPGASVVTGLPTAGFAASSELTAIMAAVCAETGTPADALAPGSGGERVGAARTLAASLAVRRLVASRGGAARAFGVPEQAVRAALRRLDRTLAVRAIPAGAELAVTVRVVAADWGLDRPASPGIAEVKRAVCAAFGVDRAEIESHRRHLPLARIRQLAMALARRLSARTLPEIGRHFGGRDHTTVIHAVRRMAPVITVAAHGLDADASVDDWARAARAALENQPGGLRASGTARG